MSVSASTLRDGTGLERADDTVVVGSEKDGSVKRHVGVEGADVHPATDTNDYRHHSQVMSNVVWFLVCISVLLFVFLFALDNTIVANAQPSIIRTFGEIEKLPWIALAFALGAIATSVTWGRLFNLFDGKKLFCIAVLLFEIGSAVCGAAPTFNSLIVGRAIAGVGGGGIYIGTINLVARFTSLKERPLYMAFIGSMWSGGTILGPIVGGAFADSKATWRWAFYLNLCLAAPTTPVLLFMLPSQRPLPNQTVSQRARQLDYTGIILFAGATVSLIMGINFGGSIYPWRSGQVISLFVVTIVLWAAFVVQQTFSLLTTPKNRIFPIKFIKSLQISLLAAQSGVCTAAIYILMYFTPLYYQYVRGESAVRSGVLLLPWCLVAVVGAVINGLALARVGVYMPWFLAGGILVTIGTSLMHTLAVDTSYARIIGYGVIAAFGAGLFIQAPFAIAQAKVQQSDVVNVTTFVTCGQIFGITVGLSIAASVFINRATDKLTAAFPEFPASLIQSAIQGDNTDLLNFLSPSQKQTILTTLVETIDEAYVMNIVAGGLVIILSLMMKRERIVIPAFF